MSSGTDSYLTGLLSADGAALLPTNPVIFEFALGVVVAEIVARRKTCIMKPGLAWLAIASACGAIIAFEQLFDIDDRLLGFGVPSAVILAAVLDPQRSGLLAPRFLRFLGDASYETYLAEAGAMAAITKFLVPRRCLGLSSYRSQLYLQQLLASCCTSFSKDPSCVGVCMRGA